MYRAKLVSVLISVVLVPALLPICAAEVGVGGRVVDVNGAAVPRAEVKLLPLLDRGTRARHALLDQPVEPVAAVLSDERGYFRIASPSAGLWVVRVESPGFVPVEYRLTPQIETIELPDAELPPDTGLAVRVTAGENSPVAGALLILRSEPGRFAFGRSGWASATRIARSGEDGTARLPLGDRERWSLSASAAGLAPHASRGLHGSAATVRLQPGTARSLEVRSSDGKPVAEVLVTEGPLGHPLGRTDSAGLLALRSAGNRLELELLAEDSRQAKATLDLDEREPDQPIVLALPDRLLLVGRLIDADSRRAIAGGLVWDRENPMEGVITDSAGGFVLGGPKGRLLRVTAGAPGYMNSDGFEFLLDGSGRPGPTVALEPAAAIEGIVVDSDGEPVAAAEVELSVRRSPGGMMRIEIGGPVDLPRARTGDSGRFRVSPLDPDQRYDVRTEAEGFAPAELAVTELAPYRTKSGLRVVLDRGNRLTGSVVDAEGSPLADAAVFVKPAAPARDHGMIRIMDPGGGAPPVETATDREGRFVAGGLAGGTFDVEVKRPGFATGKLAGIEIAEQAGEVEAGEIVLERGERIAGIVVDRDGIALEGVEVFLEQPQAGMAFMMMGGPGPRAAEPDALTDPAGWFFIDDLGTTERYALRFRRTGFVAKTHGGIAVPQSEPLEVRMEPASRVVGTVLDPEGEPIPAAEVEMTRSSTVEMGGNVMKTMMMMSEQTDAQGRFVFEDQEPGKITLKGVASGYREAKLANLEIPKGEDLIDVEIPLEAGALVDGRVLAPDGRPAIGATIRRVSEDREALFGMGGAVSDGNGYFRLDGLEPGEASIEANHDDFPRTVRDIELDEGLQSIELQFQGGQEVTGAVVDSAGTPVGEARVRLVPAGRMWGGPETATKGDGTFSMPGVQNGSYRLWVESESHAPETGEQQVVVEGQPVTGLQVTLDAGAQLVGRIAGLAPERFSRVRVQADGPTPGGFGGIGVDREGNYMIERLLPGDYEVVATLSESAMRARGNVTLEPGATEARLDLTFETGLTLTGLAVQAENPITDASVFAEGIDVRHEGWTQTDTAGRFSLEGLQPGSYRIRLQKSQSGLTYDEQIELATSREITLKVPAATIAGRILDGADRQPLSGVSITLQAEESSMQGRLPSHSAGTDLEGRFLLNHVGDGTWKLTAEREGYAAVTRDVQIQHDRDVPGLEMTMDPTEGLNLQVSLPSGLPPAELRVAVIDGSGGELIGGTYATGENGRVRLSTVPPGRWEVMVSAAGAATSSVEATAPGATVAVQLQPPCSLLLHVPELAGSDQLATVRVHGPDGKPFRQLTWSGRAVAEWPMGNGRLEFGSLPPGNWSVSVTTADGRSWQGQVSTSVTAAADLVLE